ncbi:MAG TPA: YceI family protein [Verrucomicrobiae bacterium]|nr:YceI family protein [Verrucomicrobiae bacterium]
MARCVKCGLGLFRRWPAFAAVICFVLLTVAQISHAQETVVTFDTARTQVSMTLDATLHTVHGTFKLKRGVIEFDPRTGKAQGTIVIDATSGNTDNASRDAKMHQQVLDSAKFPEISFLPADVKGSMPQQGSAQFSVNGTFRIHGQDHPLSIVAEVSAPSGGSIHLKTSFPVPYQKWGMKNPSNFFLHVGDSVEIEIDATAELSFVSGATP